MIVEGQQQTAPTTEAPTTESEAPGGSAPTDPAPSFDDRGIDPAVRDLMGFDPFGPSESEADPQDPPSEPGTTQAAPGDGGTEQEQVPGAGQTQPQAQPQTPSEPPTQAQPGQDQASELAALKGQIALLQSQLVQKGAGQQGGQAPAQPAAPKEPDLPQYLYNIPAEVLNALASEDVGERGKALQGIISGIGRAVHREVRNEITSHFNKVPEVVQTHLTRHQEAQRIYQDFYGEYPELNVPALYQTIAQVGSTVAQKLGLANTWNERVRDETAKEVCAMLGRQALLPKSKRTAQPPAQTAPAVTTPQAQTRAQPPHQFGMHTRQGKGAVGPQSEMEQEIHDLLN